MLRGPQQCSMTLTEQQFARIRRLALSLAGIELVGRHRELLARRTRRLGLRDSAGAERLLAAAEKGETTATQQLLCLLTTKFTGFFRQPRHFDIAAGHARRVAAQRGQARLWSAAAATGEEPWSLAMALLDVFRQEEPPASILATDVDAEALAAADRGEYSEATVGAISLGQRERYFRESQAARTWSVAPEVRRLVEFRALNLTGLTWPVKGPFDVIFCRNVLMYLEAGHRYAVLERMASLLAPDGLLLLDPAEHPGNAAHWFAPAEVGVYSRQRGLPQSRRLAGALSPHH